MFVWMRKFLRLFIIIIIKVVKKKTGRSSPFSRQSSSLPCVLCVSSPWALWFFFTQTSSSILPSRTTSQLHHHMPSSPSLQASSRSTEAAISSPFHAKLIFPVIFLPLSNSLPLLVQDENDPATTISSACHPHRSSRLLLLGCSWSESTLLSNCQRLVSPSPPSISLRFLWSSSAPFLLSPWSFLSTNTTISFLSQQAISSNTIISSFRSPVLYLFFLCHRPASPVTSPSLLSLLKLLYCRADHLCCLGKTPVRLSSSLFTGEFISSSFEFQCLLWVGLVRFIY